MESYLGPLKPSLLWLTLFPISEQTAQQQQKRQKLCTKFIPFTQTNQPTFSARASTSQNAKAIMVSLYFRLPFRSLLATTQGGHSPRLTHPFSVLTLISYLVFNICRANTRNAKVFFRLVLSLFSDVGMLSKQFHNLV